LGHDQEFNTNTSEIPWALHIQLLKMVQKDIKIEDKNYGIHI
jgi:hypothetical protein